MLKQPTYQPTNQPFVREAAPKWVFKREGRLELNPLLVQAFGITPEEIGDIIKSAEEPEAMRDMFAFLSDYTTLSESRTRLLISGDKLDFLVADLKRRMGRVAEVYRRQAAEHREFGYATASLLSKTSDKARELSNFRGMSREDKVAFIDAVVGLEHTSGSIIPIAFGITDYGREDYWPRKLLVFLRSHGMPGMVREAQTPKLYRIIYDVPIGVGGTIGAIGEKDLVIKCRGLLKQSYMIDAVYEIDPSTGQKVKKINWWEINENLLVKEGTAPAPELTLKINWNLNIREGRIVYMSPEEYLERVNIFNRIGMSRVIEDERRAIGKGYRGIGYYPPLSEQSYRSILEGIRAGNEMDIPNIVYRNGLIDNQEGFHRALVARDIGIEKIPVHVIGELPASFSRVLNLKWNQNLTEQVKAINALKRNIIGGEYMIREATASSYESVNMDYIISENITPDIENVLRRLKIEGNTVKITEQLDRKLYEGVNAVLVRLGGKWNKSAKAHIFPSDPTERINAVLTSGKLEPKIKTGYFPTPPELARRMVEMLDLKPGDKVLEPSAGQGGLLDQLPKGTQVIIGEILPENIQILKEKGYIVNFDNFLGVEVGGVTKVIMNPPFENQQDIEHVTHALRMLQPGGTLVSVMSPGIKFRDNKKTTEFIEMLDRDYYHEIIDLPEGSFKESGTGINAVLLKVTKPMSTPSTVSSEFVADTTKVNPELAARSHMGTSWDPEKRAQQEIEGFGGYVQGVYDTLKKYAKTEAQQAFLNTEIKRFQDSFAKYYNELLARKGQTTSTFITGGSGFNVRRAEKANAAEHSKYTEMIEFRDRAQAAILRELKKMAVEEAGGELEVMKKKIADAIRNHEFMVKTNAIVRKKIPDEQKIKEIQALSPVSEITVRKILTPDYMGRIGFPAYALSNDTANIHRMEERVKELERKEATPSADIEFEGGSIKDNATEDRVQIFFDKKPEQAMIDKLKGEGWRWSPSSGCWQRKRTDQAMWSAERILGIKITRERFVPVKIDPARALYEAIQREKGETAGVKTANFISIIQKLDNLPLRQQEVNRAKLLLSSLPNLTLDELIAMEKTVKQWGVTVPQIKDEIEAIYKEYLELRKSEKGQFVSTAPDKLVTIIEKEYDEPAIPKQGAAPPITAPIITAPPPQAVIELRWVYGTQDQKWHLVGHGDRDYYHGISQERMRQIGQEAARAEYLGPTMMRPAAPVQQPVMFVPPKRPLMLYPPTEAPRPAEEIMFVPNPEKMTRNEYIKEEFRRLAQVLRQQGKPDIAARAEQATDPEWTSKFAASHRDQVVLALAQGKTVSPLVMKDYPDIAGRVRKENEELSEKDRAKREQIRLAERVEESELIAELVKLPPALKRHAETEIYSTLRLPETHKDYHNRFYIALGKVRRIAFAHLPQGKEPQPLPLPEKKESLINALLNIQPGKDILIGYGDIPKGAEKITLPLGGSGTVIERRGNLVAIGIFAGAEVATVLYVQKDSQMIRIRPIPHQKIQTRTGQIVNAPEYDRWVERIKKEAPEYLPEWEKTVIKHPPLLYPAPVSPEVKKYTIPRTFKKGTIARNNVTNEKFVLETDVEALQEDKNAMIWRTNDAHGHYIYIDDQRPTPISLPPKPDIISNDDRRLFKLYENYTDDAIQKRILLNEGKLKELAARGLVRIEKGQYGTMGSAYIEQERLGISQENSGFIRVLELRKLIIAQARPEPWKLTQEEYWRAGAEGKAYEGRGSSDYNHELAVKKALSEHKPVPSEVQRELIGNALEKVARTPRVYGEEYVQAKLRKENEEILARIKAEREQIRAAERIEENELNAELNKLPPALKRHAETEIYGTLHMTDTHKDYHNRFVIALGKVRMIAFAHLPKSEKKEEPAEPLSDYDRVLKAYLENRGYELTLQDFIWADKYTLRGTARHIVASEAEKKRRQDYISKNYNEDVGKKLHRGVVVSALERGIKVPDIVLKDYPDLMKKEVPEPTDYFTLKKAQELSRENKLKLSDEQLREKSIQVQDYIRLIEGTDEYSRKTLIKGGYYAGVIHPDASGKVPVDIWLLQNLKFTLEEFDKEQQRRKQEKIKISVPTVPVSKPVQSIQDIKQHVINSIQEAKSMDELKQILRGLGFLPLPESEKRQLIDLYQIRLSELMGGLKFGERIPEEEKKKRRAPQKAPYAPPTRRLEEYGIKEAMRRGYGYA